MIAQRNYLLNNITKLSKVIFPDPKEQDKFLNSVAQTDLDVDLLSNKAVSRYVANIGYKSINIDEIEEYYTDSTISNEYCNIREYFFEIKEKAKKVLYDIDDVVQVLKKMLEEKNPTKLIELMDELNGYIGGYGSRGFQFSTRDVEYTDDFESALKEYSSKKTLLDTSGLNNLYQEAYSNVSQKIFSELTHFYKEHSKDEKDVWLGLTVTFNFELKTLEQVSCYTFKDKPKLLKDESYHGSRLEIERSKVRNGRLIQVEIAVNNFASFGDDEGTSERKARNFAMHFRRAFEYHFFEMIGYVH